ncbi:MAG: F0F1 ATP synthase subunit B [Opitutaceae bacterium]|nr:F0F1 ATP synthase subunit B [Opitutaceae bacterium]
MLSTLLVLAETTGHAVEAAAHGEATSGITKITQAFGISLPFFLAQVLSFSIVAIVLWKLAFKPVLATLDERQQKIESGLKYADEMQAKLAATQEESAAIIKKSSLEAGRIVDEARKTAKDYLDKQTQEAAQKVNDMLVKGQHAIELEHRKMLAEARTEIARLVVVTAERVLAKQLSDADRATYNESAARELTVV